MQQLLQLKPLQPLIYDISMPFLVRALTLGLITFLVFFTIIKTMDKHDTRKQMIRAIREKWEKVLYGDYVPVVKDGIVQLDKLYKANITTPQLYSLMRLHKISNITLIKRMYVNPDHEFKIVVSQAAPAVPVLKRDVLQPDDMNSLKEIN